MLLLTVGEGGRPNFRRRVPSGLNSQSDEVIKGSIGDLSPTRNRRSETRAIICGERSCKTNKFSCYISARQRTAFLDLFKVRKPHLIGVGKIPTQICTKTN